MLLMLLLLLLLLLCWGMTMGRSSAIISLGPKP